jgi:hypothetical protein
MLVCYERKSTARWLLVAGGWFVLREKYCWLVADKPSKQGADLAVPLPDLFIYFAGNFGDFYSVLLHAYDLT